MKTIVKLQTLLWMLLVLAQASAEDQGLLPIFSEPLVTNYVAQGRNLMPIFSGRQNLLCVEANRLPLKPWDPEKESLPIDLRAEATRAWSMVATQMLAQGQPSLNMISLEPLWIPDRSTEGSSTSETEFTNQWAAFLTFETPPPKFSYRTLAVFMDGTHAIQRDVDSDDVGLGALPPHPVKQGERDRSSAQTSDGGEPNPAPMAVVDPRRRVLENDFSVPRVQWNPQTDPFPLDLRSEAVRARASLAEAAPEAGASFVLRKILMTRFTPLGAILARGLNPLDHRFHWLVVFRYQRPAGATIRPWEVYMLLDGTVLAVVQAGPLF